MFNSLVCNRYDIGFGYGFDEMGIDWARTFLHARIFLFRLSSHGFDFPFFIDRLAHKGKPYMYRLIDGDIYCVAYRCK